MTLLRTELLFKPGTDQLSPLGHIVLAPPPRRTFPDGDQRERLEKLQADFYALISIYQLANPLPAMRRYLGRHIESAEHGWRRCAWLIPRMDAELAQAQIDPHATCCARCPHTSDQGDRDCAGLQCPERRAC